MIVCAALQIKDGIYTYVICGLRHADCYATLFDLNKELSKKARASSAVTEGFLTTNNEFLDRYDAYEHAKTCGQISAQLRYDKNQKHETALYSEDLY